MKILPNNNSVLNDICFINHIRPFKYIVLLEKQDIAKIIEEIPNYHDFHDVGKFLDNWFSKYMKNKTTTLYLPPYQYAFRDLDDVILFRLIF